jgi:branched-chain amino acid aminotransferase
MNEHFFIYNNQFFHNGETVTTIDNRGLRYGDGLFETMRMHQGKILNEDLHFDRLFDGMKILEFDIPKNFSLVFFQHAIKDLLLKNSIEGNARIRLMVFRNNGNIYDTENNFPNYIIEALAVEPNIELNETGLITDIFPSGKKSCDIYSNLKSNNYLLPVMAARYGKRNGLTDVILLNAHGRICESAIANIFLIKNNKIYTPPLSEGCVAGTVRRWMIEKFYLKNYEVIEKKLPIDSLLNADELFLTNSIHPVRWVQKFKDKAYSNERTKEIFDCMIKAD